MTRRNKSEGHFNLLVTPAVRSKHGEAAFSWYAAQLWSQLPDNIIGTPSVARFKSRLRTQLFSDAFLTDKKTDHSTFYFFDFFIHSVFLSSLEVL